MKPHKTKDIPALRVESPAFAMNGTIPTQFTGDGDDVAPPLAWTKPPNGTKSIAILVEDPDAPDPAAPMRTFAHWILTGIAPTMTSLPGGNQQPEGVVVGTNDFGKRGWNGPKPPIGRHRYFFKVYALDIALDSRGVRRDELLRTMQGHILAQGELIGTYAAAHQPRSSEQAGERRPPSHR